MRSAKSGSKARRVTSCRTRSGGMAPAGIRGASATDCRSTLAMNSRGVLAVNRVGVLRVHRCLARPVSVAHEPAEVEPVFVRNFAPALPALMLRNNVVKALTSRVRQQMRFLQAAPAKTGGRPLRSQCFDRNSGCSRNSVDVCAARSDGAEHQN